MAVGGHMAATAYQAAQNTVTQAAQGQGWWQRQASSQGAGPPADPAPAAPQLQALPPPPPTPALPVPAAGLTETPASEAQQRLDMLLGTLRSTRETLPPDVAKLLGEQEFQDAQQQAKALHKAVSNQTAARKELHRVRSARRQYVQSWSAYTEQLSLLLQKQLAEQERAVSAFNDTEAQWAAQLQDASSTLSRLSGGTQTILSDSEEMDTQDRAKAGDLEDDPWKSAEASRELQKRQQHLGDMLARVAAKAKEDAAMADSKRDNSRTPRRGVKDESDADSKKEASRTPFKGAKDEESAGVHPH